MSKFESIEFDLSSFKITLLFHGSKDPLVVYFDTPSRRFHFSVIALIVHEMKQKGQPEFVHIRKYKNVLQRLDQGLSGTHKSKNLEGMMNVNYNSRLTTNKQPRPEDVVLI